MQKEEYQKLVKQYEPKEDKLKNTITAFLIGGSIGLGNELLIRLIMWLFKLSRLIASSWACLIIIFLSSLFTAIGFFDNWMSKAKAGLLLPTTGFAHSVTSSAIDYKKEGLITGIGANYLKLAGSVILYGLLSAFFLCLLKVIISG